MRNLWAVFRRELTSYFISPVAYVVIILFLVLMGLFFCYFLSVYTTEYQQYQARLSYYFQMSSQNPFIAQQLPQPQAPDFNLNVTQPFYFWLSFMMLFILPMLTMRLFSEENRSGTLELLLTYPVRDAEIILGKFFACLCVFAVVLVLTLFFPLFINGATEKAPLELGPLALTYTGALCVGAAFIAVGMFLSSLTRSQIVAGVLTFGILFGFFFLWLLGYAGEFLEQYIGLFKNKAFFDFFRHLSIFGHNENFLSGLLDTRDLLYCFNFTLGSLFLCWLSLGTRKWRA